MESNEPRRLRSLDIFRGLTIAGMIVVNSPGNDDAFAWVAHADWNGWTPADLVFPSFLVIMGLSLTLSMRSRRERGHSVAALLWQICRRTFMIFAFGLISSAILFDFNSIHDLRFLGVLQRISICYCACSLLYLFTEAQTQAWITAALLLGYWAMMALIPVPGHGRGDFTPEGNLASFLDRKLMHGHMMNDVEDPEGILATLPSIATALMGVLAGRWLATPKSKRRKVEGLLAAGVLAALIGRIWGFYFPINKHVWTSSFALFSAGIALAGLALCYAFLDRDTGWRHWLGMPFEIFGRNALISYFSSGLFYGVLDFIPVRSMGEEGTVKLWLTDHLFGAWMGPREASLAYALLFTAACLGFMAILHRKKIFVKI